MLVFLTEELCLVQWWNHACPQRDFGALAIKFKASHNPAGLGKISCYKAVIMPVQHGKVWVLHIPEYQAQSSVRRALKWRHWETSRLLKIWLSTASNTITPIKQYLYGRSPQTLAEINFQQYRHLLATQYLKLNETIKRRFAFKTLYISCVWQRRFFRINIAQKTFTVI